MLPTTRHCEEIATRSERLTKQSPIPSRSLLFLLLLLILPLISPAQDLYRHPVSKGYSINYDNDFFSATDYYFTQGIRFEIYSPIFKKLPTRYALLRLRDLDTEGFGITLNQQCFTPTSIRRNEVQTNNHPFAGAIFLGFTRVSQHSALKKRMSTELILGGIGPCASCRETQENIHKWLDNIQPLGWQYQVRNDVVINYNMKLERSFYEGRGFDMQHWVNTSVGTLYTNAGFGLRMRGGWMDKYFEWYSPSHKFRFYGFVTGEVRCVAYNGAFQGGLFDNTSIYVVPSAHMERVVGTCSQGLVLAWRKMRLEYTKYFQSPQFKYGRYHSWGHCSMTLAF